MIHTFRFLGDGFVAVDDDNDVDDNDDHDHDDNVITST